MSSQSQSTATAYRRPESVLVVVATCAGDVLLLERVRPPGYWQSVTGSLHWGETAQAAARRELAEETGLRHVELVDCGYQNRFRPLPGWGRRFAPGVTENVESVFRVILPGRRQVQLDPAEHCRAVWLPRVSAAARVFSWTNREAILKLVPGARGAR